MSTVRAGAAPQPTTVEHAGETLTVTSPGGFVGGINPSNIITHPAVPRYRSLAEAAASLGIAERQGIGVARMTRDLLAIGRPRPQIYEIPGPYVQVALLGGEPDPEMVRLVSDITPQGLAETVDTLLLIDEMCGRGGSTPTRVHRSCSARQLKSPTRSPAWRPLASATSRMRTAAGPRT